jgi:hypothetical protein
MNLQTTQREPPPPVLGPDDPPPDFPRELAAHARMEQDLARRHLGKIALVHGDEVVGAFDTADDAFLEGFRHFGHVRVMVKEIRDPNAPLDFVSLIDPNHPSSTPVDSRQTKGRWVPATVHDRLVLPARVPLTRGQEQLLQLTE